nr:hypothetical protein [Tanacetum cinerariifolium]
MALTFVDTYNMIAYLTKSDASESFEQILDFLNASVIQFALTVNPTIYVSCIKQFWSSVSVKKVNDVIRLQALIDKRKVIITKDTVRQALHLDDAKSINCFPNEEIFVELARMGLLRNVDNSSKFYMYPRFLQLMISAQVSDLSSHTTKYTSPALTQKVFANMRRVGKGFSGVDTPLFVRMLVPWQAADDVANVADDDVADDVDDVVAKDAAEPTPPSPTPIITPPPPQELPSISQLKLLRSQSLSKGSEGGCIQTGGIAKIDVDEDVILEEVDAEKDAKVAEKDAAVQGRQEESQAHAYHIDLEHADKVLKVVTAAATTITAAPSATRKRKGVVIRDPEETATPSTIVHSETKSKDNGKGILVEEPKPLKKQAQIEQDKAYARELEDELNKNINWDDVIEQVKRKEKEDNAVLRYQALKRKPQTEAQARKNMTHFNSVVGFLEKSEKQLEEEARRALKRKNESLEHQAVKKEDLEMLWQIVQERFASLKPKNFSDDFLLTTLKAMFEKPNVKAHIWKNQRGIHGLEKVKSWSCEVHIITFTTTQMILLVERRYPLTRFTLDQMLNNVRLEVKEESEMSLELLRFTYCCWYKLNLLDNAADSRLRLLEQSAAADDKMKK